MSREDVQAALVGLAVPDLERDAALALLETTLSIPAKGSRNKEVLMNLIGEGAFASFSLVLHRFAKDEVVCLLAIRSMSNLARASDSVAAAMVEHEIPLFLIRTIRRHLTSIALVELGIMLLADMSVNPHVRDLIRIHNGIDIIADVMSVHKANERILDICCYCLANLSQESPDNIEAMVELGCVHLLVQGLILFSAVATIAESALAVLTNVCCNGKSERKLVGELNGGHALIQVLKQQRTAPGILQCILTIGAFAQGAPDNIDLLVNENAINLVAAKTVGYLEFGALAMAGAAVLANAIADCSPDTLPAMLDSQALLTILRVAKASPARADVQKVVVGTFLCLHSRLATTATPLQGMLVRVSIPVALSSLYALHADRAAVVPALHLLAIVLADTHARKLIEAIDVWPTLVRVAIDHVGDPTVVATVYDLVAEMCSIEIGVERLEQCRLLEVVSYTLALPEPVPAALVESALALLQRLASNIDLCELVAARCTDPLVALSQLPSIAGNQVATRLIATVLGDLAVSPLGAEVVLQRDGLRVLLAMLERDARHPATVAAEVDALRKLIRTDVESRAVLKAMGAVGMVEALRFQHSSDARVIRSAGDFLRDIESSAIMRAALKRFPSKRVVNVDNYRLPEIDHQVQLFLVAGGLLIKHCKRAAPRTRHVFVSSDLRFLVWRNSAKQSAKPESFFMDSCQKAVAGRATGQLLRDSKLFAAAKEELAFAVVMNDGRTLSLEAPTKDLRDQWVASLNALIEYRTALGRLTKSNLDGASESVEDEFKKTAELD